MTTVAVESLKHIREIPGVIHIHCNEYSYDITVKNKETSKMLPEKILGKLVNVRVLEESAPPVEEVKVDLDEVRKGRLNLLLSDVKQVQKGIDSDLEWELMQGEIEGRSQAFRTLKRRYEQFVSRLESILNE